MEDKLIKCNRCNSESLYVKNNADELGNYTHTSYNCINCGFFSNSYLKKEDKEHIDYIEQSYPQAYKDNKFIDNELGLIFYPSYLDYPDFCIFLQFISDSNGNISEKWASLDKKDGQVNFSSIKYYESYIFALEAFGLLK